MVQCAWCYNKLMGWEEGDDPLMEHKRHFPACPKFGDSKSVDVSSLVNIRNSQGGNERNELYSLSAIQFMNWRWISSL